MASPITMRKGCCCIGPLIVLVVIILALVLGAVALVNMTPNQLKMGDIEITEGVTIDEAGLGDIKIKEIFSFIKNLASPDRAAIVDNPFDPAEEKTLADSNFQGVDGLARTPDGDIDFTILLDKDVIYHDEFLVEYKDTTLAYIFNQAVAQAINAGEGEHWQEIDAQIEQISILEEDGEYLVKIIFSANIFGSKEEIKANLGGSVPNFVVNMLPDRIYFTSYSKLSVDAEGKLSTQPHSIAINGMEESPLTKAIITAMDNIDEEEDDGLSGFLSNAFAELINMLGKTGTADTDEDGRVIGNKVFGESGISKGKIKVITHTAR